MLVARPAVKPAPLEKALLALIKARAAPSNARIEALDLAGDDRVVKAIVQKAEATPGLTGTDGWSSQVAPNALAEFLASLAPISAAARLMAMGINIAMPAGTSTMAAPQRTGSPSTTVSWAGEAQPIAVRSYGINDDVVLDPRKFASLIVVSRELARRGNGEAIIRTLMREDAAAQLDGAYFGAQAGDTVAHAGLLNGVTALPGYAGGDRHALGTDLATLAEIVADGGSGQVVFVTGTKRAARLPIIAPDLEITVWPSLAVPADVIIAADPLSLVHGAGDDFEVDVTTEATLHMSDDPDPIVDGSAADPVRSVWQTDAIAARLIADVAFAKRRTGAVAWVSGATW